MFRFSNFRHNKSFAKWFWSVVLTLFVCSDGKNYDTKATFCRKNGKK